MNKVKVKYNKNTGIVEGYYPSQINYNKNVIDENLRTIDNSPYIEITEKDHQSIMGKSMIVFNKKLKEYKRTQEEILDSAKSVRLTSRKKYLESKDKHWIQKMREGKDVDPLIISRSNQAVKEINEIELLTTLEEVCSYQEVFE